MIIYNLISDIYVYNQLLVEMNDAQELFANEIGPYFEKIFENTTNDAAWQIYVNKQKCIDLMYCYSYRMFEQGKNDLDMCITKHQTTQIMETTLRRQYNKINPAYAINQPMSYNNHILDNLKTSTEQDFNQLYAKCLDTRDITNNQNNQNNQNREHPNNNDDDDVDDDDEED